MTISSEWVVFDTNVWIFGIRRQPEKPACGELLEHLSDLHVYIPFQVIRELQANLTDQELSDLFQLIARYPHQVNVDWERVENFRVQRYIELGCKLGDAVVAAHLEAQSIGILVSENRDFLVEISGLPFRVITALEALKELQ